MRKIALLAFVFVSLILSTACGSIVKYKEGDSSRSFMQGADKILVKFDYSATRVGRFATEAEYIESKMTEIDEKDPGKGEEWRVKWEEQKDSIFAYQFTKLMNDRINEKGIVAGTNLTDAPLTMIVHVMSIEPGWNVGVSRRNAEVDFIVKIYKTSDMNQPLVVYAMNKVQGFGAMGYDFDAGYRMGQSFARGGRELGRYLVK